MYIYIYIYIYKDIYIAYLDVSICREREFLGYKTSMITDEDPPRGLLFY